MSRFDMWLDDYNRRNGRQIGWEVTILATGEKLYPKTAFLLAKIEEKYNFDLGKQYTIKKIFENN